MTPLCGFEKRDSTFAPSIQILLDVSDELNKQRKLIYQSLVPLHKLILVDLVLRTPTCVIQIAALETQADIYIQRSNALLSQFKSLGDQVTVDAVVNLTSLGGYEGADIEPWAEQGVRKVREEYTRIEEWFDTRKLDVENSTEDWLMMREEIIAESGVEGVEQAVRDAELLLQ